mmetsp:Transcript_29384/g.49786  ORF Transcript_29384/g.49786 Transcript_29384/m.49786 type:complete len:221 (+) Transcript_29384:3717-4379(+)
MLVFSSCPPFGVKALSVHCSRSTRRAFIFFNVSLASGIELYIAASSFKSLALPSHSSTASSSRAAVALRKLSTWKSIWRSISVEVVYSGYRFRYLVSISRATALVSHIFRSAWLRASTASSSFTLISSRPRWSAMHFPAKRNSACLARPDPAADTQFSTSFHKALSFVPSALEMRTRNSRTFFARSSQSFPSLVRNPPIWAISPTILSIVLRSTSSPSFK